MSQVSTFEDLECWQACRRLRLFVTERVLPLLPEAERYRLWDQLVRAVRSTTANIAEGYGRFHYRDNWKFCSMARGSCYEVLDHFITACDEGFIDEEVLAEGRDLVMHAVRLLNGYMNYLSRSSRSGKLREPQAAYGSGPYPPAELLSEFQESISDSATRQE